MKIKINNEVFNTEIMKTDDEIRKGMMWRENLDGCMLFDMGRGVHSFWMRNCLIPLDIVFVFNKKISKIYRNCQPCDLDCNEKYTGMGEYVLEFPANVSKPFNVGDKVLFLND